MSRLATVLASLALLALLAGASGARAEYVKDGALICDIGDRFSGPALVMGADGSTIIAWADTRNGDINVYAQKVDAEGHALWDTEGVPVCTAADDQEYVRMMSDGAGGAYVVWSDRRGVHWDLYVQRIDGDGNTLWTANGISVCTVSAERYEPVIVPGAIAGGAIIVWHDARSGENNYDIYAQGFDGEGNRLWAAGGVPICTASGNQWTAAAVTDGADGAIIAWEDNRGPEPDIYAQRVDGSGSVLWADDGVVACAAGGNQWRPRIASDGNSGAYITWIDLRNGTDYDVYAQHLDQNGYPSWYADGRDVAVQEYHEVAVDIMADGAGNAIVLWGDQRETVPGMGMYAQKIEPFYGSPTWLWSGIPICTLPGSPELPVMISDGAGGAIIAWQDWRSGQTDIYAQRIDMNGEAVWTLNGVTICKAINGQEGICMVADGEGGAVMGWRDDRPGSVFHTYAQKISADGLWGNPEPSIVSCHDALGDQGGWVTIDLRSSPHDCKAERDYPITGYNVWRKIGSGGDLLEAADAGSASGVGALSGVGAADAAPASGFAAIALLERAATTAGVRISRAQAALLGFPEGDWLSLGFHAAKQDTMYHLAAPTASDSTASGTGWETYIVTAHTQTPGVYVVSNADSAYSVDNLAPGVTEGFAGEQSLAPAGLKLTWVKNAAPDIWKYDIHRGDNALFVPDEANLVAATEHLTLLDPGWASFYNYFYKLVAVDRHGNLSPAALLRPEDVKVGTLLQSFAASFSDGRIEVTWRLSRAVEDASFVVSRAEGAGSAFAEMPGADLKGDATAFVYADASVEPGAVYRYRVELAEGAARSVLFETDAISTPALPLTLYQNHPNPFNPSTTIRYYLPERCRVALVIFDSAGRRITQLVSEPQAAGAHAAVWSGLDDRGHAVGAGVYFYRLTAGKETIARKMVLAR